MSSSSRESAIKSPVIKQEKIEEPHSTVSVVRYNSEIELSTDTDDSASEAAEKSGDLCKIEEALKTIDDDAVRSKILGLVRSMAKEQETLMRDKDNRIGELEARIAELEKRAEAARMVNGAVAEELDSCASIKEEATTSQQTSVIASSVEQKAIVLTAE